jgi:hypothetical protein
LDNQGLKHLQQVCHRFVCVSVLLKMARRVINTLLSVS